MVSIPNRMKEQKNFVRVRLTSARDFLSLFDFSSYLSRWKLRSKETKDSNQSQRSEWELSFFYLYSLSKLPHLYTRFDASPSPYSLDLTALIL